MTFALVFITDGRDNIHQTIPSALAMLEGPITEFWLYDDSEDSDHTAELAGRYPTFTVFNHPAGRQGFGGAVRYVRQVLAESSEADMVFWCEDDFTFNREVPLPRLSAVLRTNAHIAQVCLVRQPWNDEERKAGGIVSCHPGDYIDRSDVFGNRWLEHARCYSTNPHIFRRGLLNIDWPDVSHSEGVFTHRLLDLGYRFAYWGDRYDPPWVTHTGNERVGVGY